MDNLKSHKNIEQISKKHKVNTSYIKNQLKIGVPIEYEHTNDKNLATSIALQHLDEFPDYYTRLKKMESDSKKSINNKIVKELESELKRLKNISYDSIDKLMRVIMKKHDITAKELHNAFVNKHNKTPDDWIKTIKEGTFNVKTSTKKEAVNLNKYSVLESPEVRYCPKCQKNETREECSYGPKYWDKYSTPAKKYSKESKDHEYSMARSQLATITSAAQRLKSKMKGEGNIEAWVQSKITKAADYLDAAADYIDSGEHDVEESISFNISHTSKDAQNARRKKKISDLAQRGVGGEKENATRMAGVTLPTVKKEEKLVDKILDEILEKKDPCWKGYTQVGMKMKNRKEVPNCVPVKKGVKKAKGYRKENVSIEDANGNTFAEVIDIIKPEPIKGFKSQIDEVTRLQSQSGNVMAITLNWRGKYYFLKMFFPQSKIPNRSEINAELQKIYPGAKVVSHSVSEIEPGQPLIQTFTPQGGSSPKLGPNKNYVKPMGESVEFDEDWQKVNRNDNTDGLSQRAVNAYRKENPGSKLKTAVTEKNPKGKRASRRKSFCSRSAGQRDMHNIDCSSTPDKPICKARKRWRCN